MESGGSRGTGNEVEANIKGRPKLGEVSTTQLRELINSVAKIRLRAELKAHKKSDFGSSKQPQTISLRDTVIFGSNKLITCEGKVMTSWFNYRTKIAPRKSHGDGAAQQKFKVGPPEVDGEKSVARGKNVRRSKEIQKRSFAIGTSKSSPHETRKIFLRSGNLTKR